MTVSVGSQAQLALEPLSGTFDGSSVFQEFVSESLRKSGTIIDTNGYRGSRSHNKRRTRQGNYTVGGSITINPDPVALTWWLPRILGAAESSDTFSLAETIPEFSVMFDRVAKCFTYRGCKVARAILRGSGGGLITLELQIIGQTETVSAAGSFPAISLGTASNYAPYYFADVACTLVSSSRTITSFELTIDNVVTPRVSNQLYPSDVFATDRIVSFRCSTPWRTGDTDLYAQDVAGAAASIVITNGGLSTTISMPALQAPDNGPIVASKGEILLEVNGIARESGTTDEIEFENDDVA